MIEEAQYTDLDEVFAAQSEIRKQEAKLPGKALHNWRERMVMSARRVGKSFSQSVPENFMKLFSSQGRRLIKQAEHSGQKIDWKRVWNLRKSTFQESVDRLKNVHFGFVDSNLDPEERRKQKNAHRRERKSRR